jgi:hypothetical protein
MARVAWTRPGGRAGPRPASQLALTSRTDGLHDDRAALVAELHVAIGARFDYEVHPAGEPVAQRQS